MLERVAEASAGTSVMDDRLSVDHLAGQGRGDRLTATHGKGYLHVRIRKASVGLETQHPARLKNVIIPTLQSGEIAARSAHEIEIERKIE